MPRWHSIVNEPPERETERDRERERERELEQTWGGVSFTEQHDMVLLCGKKVRNTTERKLEIFEEEAKEEKCLPLYLHTSCGRVQECLLSHQTKLWLPPAAEDDSF